MGSSRTRHSTRARRASSRRLSPSNKPASEPSPPPPSLPSAVTDALVDVVWHLKIVHAVLICAAKALREQSIEMDSDVALAIQRCGSDTIDAQIERLNKLLDPDSEESAPDEEGDE